MTPLLAFFVLQPQTAAQLSQQGEAAYTAKQYAKSAALYRQAYRLNPKDLWVLYNEACSLALGGERVKALAALEELAKKGYNNDAHLKTDADLASLHDDPRWPGIVAKTEANARRDPPLRWKKPYVALPAPTDPAPFEARLGSEDSTVWREGDVLSFLVRRTGAGVRLSGGIQEPMQRIGASDLWIAQFRLPDWDRALVTYGFRGDPPAPGEPYVSKLWRGPEAPAFEQAEPLRGRVIERTLGSRALGEDRKIHVYLPPDAPRQDLPAVFLADGQDCESFARALEPLILAHKVRPCAIVGVDDGEYEGDRAKAYDPTLDKRAREYLPDVDPPRFAKHLRFFVDEVGALVAKEYGLSRRRQDRAVTGFSNGGVFALEAAYRRPEAFGTAMPLSLGIPPTDDKPKRGFPRLMFAAGTLETMIASTEAAYKRTKTMGADATFETYVAGHDPELWRLAFARMMPRVFPAA